MRVRIRAPNGVHTITLEDVANVGTLLDAIREKSSIKGGIAIKHGFPPKPLELHSYDRGMLLIDLPVTVNGEQLIVSESEAPLSTAPSVVKTSIGPSSGPLSNSQGTLLNQHERDLSFPNDPPNPFKNWFGPSGSSSASKASKSFKGQEPIVQVEGMPGWSCTMRVMEDDNSCMFRAVNYVCARGLDMMTELRGVVASVIQADADLPEADQRFTKVVLGTSRDKYCEKIADPNIWGGYIDLTILSEYFATTIYSISVDDGSVVTYNEGQPTFAIVIYSGIHYDCVALTQATNDPDDDTTVFEKSNTTMILGAAEKLCRILKSRNYATNLSTFSIRCDDCGTGLTGTKQAQEHGAATGHWNFAEYNSAD
ncbi:ubiquitin-specific protease otu1 [Arthrobotrys musiformis]|uniref:Ubiquitin thioesterase OTU n=1 Tax=Arthrobotrys musiformis TaxID=47236 RepID=A0AAV9WIG3_9PEZI